MIAEYHENGFKLPEPVTVPEIDYIEKVKPLMAAIEKKFPELLNKELKSEKKRERKRIKVKPKAIIVHSEKIGK